MLACASHTSRLSTPPRCPPCAWPPPPCRSYLFRLRGLVVSSVAAAPEALPTEYLWGEELERLPP